MEWTSQLEKEFLDLKASLSSETILKAPDFDRPFTLHTDASARGIGAVLYLLGCHFTLITDHKALQHLQTMDNSNQRLIRWSLVLQQYDFHVAYLPGKENGNADSLSRQPFEEATFSGEEGGR